jgi:hypothetical protein
MKKRYVYLCMIAVFAIVLIVPAQAGAPAAGKDSQKVFATPDQAIHVLMEACRTNNDQKLIELFGAENKDIIITRDRAMDAYGRKKIYQASLEKIVKKNKGKDTIIVEVGKMEFPFPFPLVKSGAGWRFDSAAGREDIINRRVGRDELNAIAVCRLYVKAQRQYYSKDRDKDDVLEYAEKFASSPGKKDGLYWASDPAKKEEASPIGPALSESKHYTAIRKQGDPFFGYYFRILTKQGEKAPGGAHDYMINGNLLAGYALIAYPSDYGTSGVVTFIVNQRGKVYQKDLGKETLKLAEEVTEYNPDKGWIPVQESGTLARD